MPNVNMIRDFQFGLHASTADLTTVPGTMRRLAPLSVNFAPRPRTLGPRARFSIDNRPLSSVVLLDDLSPITITQELRGIGSHSTGAYTTADQLEYADQLTSAFGAAAAAVSAVFPTVAGGSGSARTLTANTTTVANDDIVGFAVSSPAGFVIRRVVSGGGTINLVLDGDYVGTPVNASNIFRGKPWSINNLLTAHTHGYLRQEGEDHARAARGLACSNLTITVPLGEVCTLATTWTPTSLGVLSETNPTFAEPNGGALIPGVSAQLVIGDDLFMVRDLSVVVDFAIVPRASVTGENGVVGYTVTQAHNARIAGTFYVGSNSPALGEIIDGSGNIRLGRDLNSELATRGSLKPTFGIGLQLGLQSTGGCYVSIPAAELHSASEVGEAEGQSVVAFTATARQPASGSPFFMGFV